MKTTSHFGLTTLTPTPETDKIVNSILELLPDHSEQDAEEIQFLLLFHECEASAAAERISENLGLDYKTVYNLIP